MAKRLVAKRMALIVCAGVATVDPGAALLLSALLWALLQLSRGGNAALRVRVVRADEIGTAGPGKSRDAQLIEAEGALSFLTVPQIDTLLPEQPPWPSYVVFDLRRVTYIDTSALAALTHLIDCLDVRAGRFALVCAPRSEILALLQRWGLARRALGETCCFSVAQALERFASRPPPRVAPSPRARPALRLVRVPAE